MKNRVDVQPAADHLRGLGGDTVAHDPAFVLEIIKGADRPHPRLGRERGRQIPRPGRPGIGIILWQMGFLKHGQKDLERHGMLEGEKGEDMRVQWTG